MEYRMGEEWTLIDLVVNRKHAVFYKLSTSWHFSKILFTLNTRVNVHDCRY